MNTSIYPAFMPVIMKNLSKKSYENTTPLRLQIEPWAFDTIRENCSKSEEYSFQLIKQNLYDCILKFKLTVADTLTVGTEIMLNFADATLIFEVKNYSNAFNQNQVEELYILDLSNIIMA